MTKLKKKKKRERFTYRCTKPWVPNVEFSRRTSTCITTCIGMLHINLDQWRQFGKNALFGLV